MDYQQVFERSPAPAVLLSRGLQVLACNNAFERMLALPQQAMLGQTLFHLFPGSEDSRRILQQSLQHVLDARVAHQIPLLEYPMPAAARSDCEYWSFHNTPLMEEGEVGAILCQPLNLSALVQIEPGAQQELSQPTGALLLDLLTALEAERERFDQLFQQAPGFICILRGPDHVFELANDAYYQLIGHRHIIGQVLADVLPEVIEQGFLDKLDRVYRTGEPFIGRAVPIELQRVADGPLEERFIDLTYQPINDASGKPSGIFVLGHDVTEAHRLSQEVTFQAAHDALTGLRNRREVARQMAELEQAGGSHALVYLDLDHFKIINDRCGHRAGDKLLTEVAQLLRQHAAEDDTLARLGGDEFAMVLRNCELDDAQQRAQQVCDAIRQLPFPWRGRRYTVTCSAGVACFGSEAAVTFSDGLGLADAACFLAKEKGRNQVVVSQPSDEEVRRRQQDMDWTDRLREAMREDRVVLFGQRFDNLSGAAREEGMICCEVLARLRGADGELIAPGAFIPAAERYGLIGELDRHIIHKAFSTLQQLDPAQRQRTRYFINVSGLTLGSRGFVDYVFSTLARFPDVQPGNICFEVTETAAISSLTVTAGLLGELVNHGFQVALDDFGSGMSSFAYLQHLPVQYLKIDGEFIKGIRNPPAGSVIVESVIQVARAFNIRTIAESVEWSDLVPVLQGVGADYGQGFALHRPQPLPL